VLGLALQETLGNLMAGIALLFEKPFTIGDWIEVGDQQGEVVEVNWRSVHVRTRERNLLVFPNAVLGRESIVNYARPNDTQTLRLSFAFSLEDPPNRVKDVLCSVAEQMPLVLNDPPPRALSREVLDDRIRYEAFLFIDEPRQIPQIVDEYTSKVWYAMQRAGIRLPLPAAYEINVAELPAATATVDIQGTLTTALGFEVLSSADLDQLVGRAEVQQFADTETIVASGTIAEAVYVIESGECRAMWTPHGEVVAQLLLKPGETVGLTSLTRQQPSTIQIECQGDVCVLRLERSAVEDLLQSNTRFAHELAHLQTVRMDGLQRARDEWVASTATEAIVLPVSMRKPQSEPDEADGS